MMAINTWPKMERPRERIIEHGVGVLTDAELLAVFLTSGTAGRSAVDMARSLILTFGSLRAFVSADRDRMLGQLGVGPARYALLRAALELSRRCSGVTDVQRKDGTIEGAGRIVGNGSSQTNPTAMQGTSEAKETMANARAQLVTVPVLDARLAAVEAKHDSRSAAVNVRFDTFETKMNTNIQSFKAILVRWLSLGMLASAVLTTGITAILNAFQR